MNVLLVHNRYRISGGEDAVVEQELNLLRQFGHHVTPWLTSSHEYCQLPVWKRGVFLFWNHAQYVGLRRIMRQVRPDIMHVHNTYPLISPAAIHAAAAEGVPVVMSVHNFRLWCLNAYLFRQGRVCQDCLGTVPWRGVLRECYRSRSESLALSCMTMTHRCAGTWGRVRVFVALSEFARGLMLRGGIPAERIWIKPNFLRDPYSVPVMRSSQAPRALYVGRLNEEKGVDTLIRAWRSIGPVVPLDVIGDPVLPDGSAFSCPKVDGVRWLGQKTRAEVVDLMARATYLIVPSQSYEGLPMVCLEGFAAGMTVVASRLGGLPSIVRDNENGLLFTPGDADDLTAKVLWLHKNPAVAARLGDTARQDYERLYTPERNHELVMGIYRQARHQVGIARA